MADGSRNATIDAAHITARPYQEDESYITTLLEKETLLARYMLNLRVLNLLTCAFIYGALAFTKPRNSNNHVKDNLIKTIMSASSEDAEKNDDGMVTILGFGSLLSERSSRMTFPELQNFRLGRVPNYRRVFGHPTSIFFQRGIAKPETKEMSSLSAEHAPGYPGFICSVFETPNKDMMNDGVPSEAFLLREEEFGIIMVPYEDHNTNNGKGSSEDGGHPKQGILCTVSTDEEYLRRWGRERFEEHFVKYGISQIWGWAKDSGLKPCPVYLRHCYLAAKSMGDDCFNSFLDDTFLVDRKTTLREYLADNPRVLECEVPPELQERYCG